MTVLGHSEDGETYPKSVAGTISTLAEGIYDKLLLKGYSLATEDVEKLLTDECRFYSGWAMFEIQKQGMCVITNTLQLDTFEWALIEPLLLASCDLEQANRMEATRSLGTEQFGLTVGEAVQIYNQRRDELPKMAFVAPPFSIDLE